MSARLEAVGAIERRTLPVPYGNHVYVVSDLSLSPATAPDSRPVTELVQLLGDIDDAALVVVAGNLLFPSPTSDLAKLISATFASLPALRDAIHDAGGRCAGLVFNRAKVEPPRFLKALLP